MELRAAGAAQIFGLSVQAPEYQKELVRRLHLSYAMLSDEKLALGAGLALPTFEAGEATFHKRLTLIVQGTLTEHVFFPVFPPDQHALRVLEWLTRH